MESTAYHSQKAGTKKENSRKQIVLTSEKSSGFCRSRKKSLKQNTMIKTSFVLLKNNRGRKEKHEDCLRTPCGKELAPQTQHKKFEAFKKLQVALYDILDKNCVPTLKKSFQIPNVGALLEKEKKDTPERGTTEMDCSTEAGEHSGEVDPGQRNSDGDVRKPGDGAKSPTFLRDQSLLATFSFIEPSHGKAAAGPCHAKTGEERKGSFRKASVLISDAEKPNTKCSEWIAKCMESGSHVVKETEKEGDPCYKTEDSQNVETGNSRGSSEATVSDMTEPNSPNSISTSDKGVLQSMEIIPAFNRDTFSKTPVSRMTLTDQKAQEGGRGHGSDLFSPFTEINLKLDLQTLLFNKSEIKLPIKEMNTLAEKILEDPMTFEEEERNTRDSNKNIESFWFLLKNNEIQCHQALVCVADEKKSGDLEYGEGVSDRGTERLPSEGNLTDQIYPDEEDGDDDGTFPYTEIQKAAISVGDEEGNFFNNEKENMDSTPAEGSISVGV